MKYSYDERIADGLYAAKGLEGQTRKLFAVCRLRGLPVFTFVNKMDRPAMEPMGIMDEIEAELELEGRVATGYRLDEQGLCLVPAMEAAVLVAPPATADAVAMPEPEPRYGCVSI